MEANNKNYAREQSNESSITLSDILRVLRKNWILIGIITVVIFVAGIVYTFGIAKPTYKATATIKVEVPIVSESSSSAEVGNSVTASLRYVQSVAEYAKSKKIMSAVVEKNKGIIESTDDDSGNACKRHTFSIAITIIKYSHHDGVHKERI